MRNSIANNKWVKKCKLCQLYVSHPELWVEIHNRILKKGESRRSIVGWLNEEKIPSLNQDLSPTDPLVLKAFSEQNFQNHFTGSKPSQAHGESAMTGHAQDFYAVKRQLEGSGITIDTNKVLKGAVLTPDEWLEAENYVTELNKELMDYQSLSSMVDSLESLLTRFNTTLRSKIDKDDRIALIEIEQFQKQVTALFKLTNDLTDLRNKAPIAGEAAKLGIEMCVGIFLDALIDTVKEAAILLEGEMPGTDLPRQVTEMILVNTKDSMKSAIPEILKKVMSEYRIR